MAKARTRTTTRKGSKDKWRSKTWYQIIAPPAFDNVPIADTLADGPGSLTDRITEVSMQDLTNDFRRSHIKLYFKINKIEESQAHTQFIGHTLTSDYVRRLVRRRRSRVDGVYDVTTRDGAFLRVKPFATTEKRIQNSQKRIIRSIMKKTIFNEAKAKTLSEFMRDALDGKIGSEIYKNCKNIYPVKRIEVYKTEVMGQPTIEIVEEKKPSTEEKAEEQIETMEEKKEEMPVETKEPEIATEEKAVEERPVKESKAAKKKKTVKKTVKKEKEKKTATKKTKKVKSKKEAAK